MSWTDEERKRYFEFRDYLAKKGEKCHISEDDYKLICRIKKSFEHIPYYDDKKKPILEETLEENKQKPTVEWVKTIKYEDIDEV